MAMSHRFQDDDRRTRRVAARSEIPRSASDLREWIRDEIPMVDERAERLFEAIESVLTAQRQLVEQSKHEAIRALSEGFAEKLSRLQRQLTEKDVTVSNIARYFEDVVASLTEKSHRDPKTKLLNFDWFMERLESFLSVEQRVRWCGIGVVCLRLGSVAERRGVARKLAADLIHRADQLMYDAKGCKADHVYRVAVEVRDGGLAEITSDFIKAVRKPEDPQRS